MVSELEAIQFFRELSIFSDRYVKLALDLDSALSPWGSGKHDKQHRPFSGAILHYTGDEDLDRTLKWFLVKKYNAKVSAHAVIADRKLASAEELLDGLPLVQSLPTTVVQCRSHLTGAAHATWVNSRCYGIENVCAGELKKQETGSFTSRRARTVGGEKWTTPWAVPYKEPVQLYNRWWSPYTPGQIQSNVIVLRYLQAYYESLTKPWILGHEAMQGFRTLKSTGKMRRKDKRDPGPAFPMAGVREAVFEDKPIDHYDWYKLFCGDYRSGESSRDHLVVKWARQRNLEAETPTPEEAWELFVAALHAVVNDPDSIFGSVGKVALALLGYEVTDPMDELLEADDRVSIAILQRCLGLTSDGLPGAITRMALLGRMIDRGFLAQ